MQQRVYTMMAFLLFFLCNVAISKPIARSLDQLIQESDVVVLGSIIRVEVTPEKNSYQANKILWEFRIQKTLATRTGQKTLPETIPVCIYSYLINGESFSHDFDPAIFFLWKADDCYVFAGESIGYLGVEEDQATNWGIVDEPRRQPLDQFTQKVQKRSKVLWKKPRKKLDPTLNFG